MKVFRNSSKNKGMKYCRSSKLVMFLRCLKFQIREGKVIGQDLIA